MKENPLERIIFFKKREKSLTAGFFFRATRFEKRFLASVKLFVLMKGN